jgi:hypothetical protein
MGAGADSVGPEACSPAPDTATMRTGCTLTITFTGRPDAKRLGAPSATHTRSGPRAESIVATPFGSIAETRPVTSALAAGPFGTAAIGWAGSSTVSIGSGPSSVPVTVAHW